MAALTINGRAPALPSDAFVTETADEYVVRLADRLELWRSG